MRTLISFSCLSVALCVLVSEGCCHVPPRNHATVPSKDVPCSFDKAPFISPRIIQDFSSWISDHEDQVVAINVLESQDSNRYYGNALVRNISGQNPYVYHETATVGNSVFVGKDTGWFTVSGGTGGGWMAYDRKDRVLQINLAR